jgi:hypothetical protein
MRDGHCGGMGVELTETRRGGLKKVLLSHDGSMRVPRGKDGCEKLKVKFTEAIKR